MTSISIEARPIFTRAPRASADGRWIVFISDAPNLVAGQVDVNRLPDVFLRDLQTGTTLLVSRAAGTTSTAANHASYRPSLSTDGRYVTFLSCATDLVPGQVDELPSSLYEEQDLFLFDRVTESMVLVSRKEGTAATAASGEAWDAALSADGRFLAFLSTATDLVASQVDSAETPDLFLYDREAGTTKLVSHRSGAEQTAAGAGAFALSGNGGWLAFLSPGGDLVPGQSDVNNGGESSTFDLFLQEVSSSTVTLVTHASGSSITAGNSGSDETDIPSISADGSRIAFASKASDLVSGIPDTNSAPDVFLYDRIAGSAVRVDSPTSLDNGGTTPALSSNGAWIAFISEDNVWLVEAASGSSTLVSHASSSGTLSGNARSENPSVTGDGTKVLFESAASDLVTGQNDPDESRDLFLFDRASGTISLIDHASGSAVTPAPVSGADSLFFGDPFLTDDGHTVFMSWSGELVSGLRDRNRKLDVFIYDSSTGTNEAVSVHAPSLPSVTADDESNSTSVSADGRLVVFTSRAADLVPGQDDRNGDGTDVFLYDRVTGAISLVSHTAGSAAATGNGASPEARISRDGRFVVFSSLATDLVTGQVDVNGDFDVFLYESASGLVTLLSHAASAANQAGNSVSAGGWLSTDGRFIAFSSNASNLISGVSKSQSVPDVFLHDCIAGTTTLVSHSAGMPSQAAGGASEASGLSADGRFLVLTSTSLSLISGQMHGNSNADTDVFLYDRDSGAMTLVSRANGLPTTTASGASYAPDISGGGQFVVFVSQAFNLVPGQTDGGENVFVYDRSAGTMALVSHASGSAQVPGAEPSYAPSIDDRGNFIVFESLSSNLVAGQIDQLPGDLEPDEDVFLYDRRAATSTLVSHTAGSAVTCADNASHSPRISGDGTQIAFLSGASDLLTGEPFSGFDAYLHHRLIGMTTLLSPAIGPPVSPGVGGAPVTPAAPPSLSQDGRFVAFSTEAPNLIAQDFNNTLDIFLFSDPLPPTDFFTVEPCRLLDTRQASQGPALVSGVLRTAVAHGLCGIPETARTIAVNLTVVNPSGAGYLTAFQGDFLVPPVASTLTFGGLQTRSTSAVVALASDGTLALQASVAAGGSVHVILDVTGYFE